MIRVLHSPAFVPTSPLPSTARRRSVNRNRWLYRVSIPAFVAIFAMVALTTAAQALDSKSPDETSRESTAATVLQMRTSGEHGNGMPEIVWHRLTENVRQLDFQNHQFAKDKPLTASFEQTTSGKFFPSDHPSF